MSKCRCTPEGATGVRPAARNRLSGRGRSKDRLRQPHGRGYLIPRLAMGTQIAGTTMVWLSMVGCAARLDLRIGRAPNVPAPERGVPGQSTRLTKPGRRIAMARFLVRCASVAISASVLAVGAGRAD